MILKNYKGIEVEDIYLGVYVEENEEHTFEDNEEFVCEWLNKNNLEYDFIENPIDNLVLIYSNNIKNNIDMLEKYYKMASEDFSKVEINIDLESFNEDGYNCVDCTLKDFKTFL